MGSLINLDGLYAAQQQKVSRKQDIYWRLLHQCHRRIRYVNDHYRRQECYYQIPTYIVGYPVYSVREASAFIQEHLLRNGLFVTPLKEHYLYISWRPEDIDRERYEETAYGRRPGEALSPSAGIPTVEPTKTCQVSANQIRLPPPPSPKKRKGTADATPESAIAYLPFDNLLMDLVPVNRKKVQIRQ